MSEDSKLFLFCQKLVLMRNDDTEVFLAKRKGEADYDGTFSLIGGRMETSDVDILAGIKREKYEEVGEGFKISVCPTISYNIEFTKSSGQRMILPHYYAKYVSGEPVLNEEYSDCRWVKLSELEAFSPKIENIPGIVQEVLRFKFVLTSGDFIEI